MSDSLVSALAIDAARKSAELTLEPGWRRENGMYYGDFQSAHGPLKARICEVRSRLHTYAVLELFNEKKGWVGQECREFEHYLPECPAATINLLMGMVKGILFLLNTNPPQKESLR